MSVPADRPPFRSAVRQAVRPVDVALLGAMPAALVGAFFLPMPVRRALSFSYTDPSLLTAFTATFVHRTPSHLLANILGYVLLASVGYLLAVLADRRRLFGVAATTYVLAFGPILWMLNLAVPRSAVGYGFSGVEMAFAGLLPLLLVEYAGRRFVPWLDVRHAPALFFGVLAGIGLLGMPRTATTLTITGISGIIALTYGGSIVAAHRAYTAAVSPDSGTHLAGWLELLAVGAVTAVAYPIVGFPTDPVAARQVVNLYVHFLGYGLAFIGPYVALETGVFDR